jgi:hypothetical protein
VRDLRSDVSEGSEVPSHRSSSEVQDANTTHTPGLPEFPTSLLATSDPILSSNIPAPPAKHYAHRGKRRRSYTEELFRCQFTDMISRTPLVCNHLLWKNRPQELREHLQEHLTLDEVQKLSDDDVLKSYANAKKIYLEGIPEDDLFDDGSEDNSEDGEFDD